MSSLRERAIEKGVNIWILFLKIYLRYIEFSEDIEEVDVNDTEGMSEFDKKYNKLTRVLRETIHDYSLVGIRKLDISDEETILELLGEADMCLNVIYQLSYVEFVMLIWWYFLFFHSMVRISNPMRNSMRELKIIWSKWTKGLTLMRVLTMIFEENIYNNKTMLNSFSSIVKSQIEPQEILNSNRKM